MDAQQEERLRYLLMAHRKEWHAGRTVGRTLYWGDGPDDMIGTMDSRALADLVVLCHTYAREQLLKDRG